MVKIRPEISADYPSIYSVNRLAFRGRDAEPALVRAIQESNDFDPRLSLVADLNEQVVGHILFSPIKIQSSNRTRLALALAPMAVIPEHQGKGIGSLLVREGLEAARAAGHTIVIVLGHPDFYPRFGFSAELAKPLICPWGDCGEAWMALELVPSALDHVAGKVIYPEAFADV